jgi:hypothetical protein
MKIYKREIHTVYTYRECEIPDEDFIEKDMDPNNIEELKEFISEYEYDYDWCEVSEDYWISQENGEYPITFAKDIDFEDIIIDIN